MTVLSSSFRNGFMINSNLMFRAHDDVDVEFIIPLWNKNFTLKNFASFILIANQRIIKFFTV